ncbi:E3 ubiquitin-protein ligase TRAIP [Tribolium madens]|uniref:E3 ubiquitin-protein ligase TRAIP n=1 Tax=Tribolium madens TaxID=41895 RepID=UPI001CF73BB2|nr:E3 ubiquitin-protein ligase TRAIP [Tribolium madens]
MNITCIICSDLILPNSEIFTTPCGHIFHYACLMQWLERAKNCPQCRRKTTEKSIHRVYLNINNVEDETADPATLQYKIDALQFQLALKDKDVQNYTTKYQKAKTQNVALRTEVQELESKIRTHESIVNALKDQISYFKEISRDRDRLSESYFKLKETVKKYANVETAINGTREAVTEMIKNESDIESLALLAATLKKTLLDVEGRKLSAEHKNKQLQHELTKYRREIASLRSENQDLRRTIEEKNAAEEANEISLFSQANDDSQDRDSPPTFKKKVEDILKSNSPYLPLKSSAINLELFTSSKLRSTTNQMSIFKKPVATALPTQIVKNSDLVYDGLGGHSKEEVFPRPGLKRRRFEPSSTSVKSRRVAPNKR